MAGHKIICKCMEVDYLTIRMAMVNHTARTVEEIQQITGAGTGCGGCIPEIEEILASVCGCTGTLLREVVDSVNAGASTVAAVGEQTKAGTDCGRCQKLIENVIQNKR
jgi:bacterioferritin-associated ferredoxin